MKKIKTFSHPTLGDIRTMTDERGEPWFVGKDVAERLGYSNTRDAVRKHVDEEDKTTVAICDDGSNYKSMTVLINESGLYSLVLSSKLPQAKEFKRWVTAEVLPQIRRTGGYIPTRDQCGRTMTDDEVLARAQEIVSSTLAQKDSLISYQQARLEAQRPMVVFYDAVAATNTTCSVAELAKMLMAIFEKSKSPTTGTSPKFCHTNHPYIIHLDSAIKKHHHPSVKDCKNNHKSLNTNIIRADKT